MDDGGGDDDVAGEAGGVRGGEVERERAPFQSDMSAPALVFPDSVNTSVGSQGR